MDGYEFWNLGIAQVHEERFGRENPSLGCPQGKNKSSPELDCIDASGEEGLSLLDDKFPPTPLASCVVSVAKAAMDESTLVSLGAVCASR
jgi:hypothetical protein